MLEFESIESDEFRMLQEEGVEAVFYFYYFCGCCCFYGCIFAVTFIIFYVFFKAAQPQQQQAYVQPYQAPTAVATPV